MSTLRHIPYVALTAGGLLVGSGAYAQSMYSIDQRQTEQQEWIHHGVRDGQLTPGETARLEQGERTVNRMQARAEADGHVSSWERQRIDNAVSRENHEIYRDEHNNRTASGGRDGWGRADGHDHDGWRGRDGWDHRDADRRDWGRDHNWNGNHNGWNQANSQHGWNGGTPGQANGPHGWNGGAPGQPGPQHSWSGTPGQGGQQGGWQHGATPTGGTTTPATGTANSGGHGWNGGTWGNQQQAGQQQAGRMMPASAPASQNWSQTRTATTTTQGWNQPRTASGYGGSYGNRAYGGGSYNGGRSFSHR